MRLYERFYLYGTYLFYILYIVTLFGLWKGSPQYLKTLEYGLQILIGVILIVLNNPFSKHKYSKTDKEIAFSAGIFIITASSLTTFLQLLDNSISNIKNTSVFS